MSSSQTWLRSAQKCIFNRVFYFQPSSSESWKGRLTPDFYKTIRITSEPTWHFWARTILVLIKNKEVRRHGTSWTRQKSPKGIFTTGNISIAYGLLTFTCLLSKYAFILLIYFMHTFIDRHLLLKRNISIMTIKMSC